MNTLNDTPQPGYTPQVGDFVRFTGSGFFCGLIIGIGALPFGKERIPAARIQGASREEFAALDELILLNRDEFPAEAVPA